MSMMRFIPFSLSNHLIPCFFGSHPKKTKAIISIQFVPSLCMNTDRLSYFGHAPRGESCEAGGQINDYYHSHWLITEHLDLGAPTGRPHAGDIAKIEWQLVYSHCSSKLLQINLFVFCKHKVLQHKNLAVKLQMILWFFVKWFMPTVMNPSNRPESGLGGACSRSIDHFSMIDDTWEFSVLRMRNPVMLTPL